MFVNLLSTLVAALMPFHHLTPAVPTVPAAIVAPAAVTPVAQSHTVRTVAPPAAVAATPVEGPQPIGPTHTVTQTQCVVNWRGAMTQTDAGSTQTGQPSDYGEFSESCPDAYAWTPPPGVTFTVTQQITSFTTGG